VVFCLSKSYFVFQKKISGAKKYFGIGFEKVFCFQGNLIWVVFCLPKSYFVFKKRFPRAKKKFRIGFEKDFCSQKSVSPFFNRSKKSSSMFVMVNPSSLHLYVGAQK